MRKLVVALLGALALAASMAVPAAALASPAPEPPQGQFFSADRQRPDNPACRELAELRRELARLQQELRRLHAAFVQARRAGNRERAEQIAHEIRRVEAEIDHVQHQIRRLLQECRGR
jgi:TolA-binding protein